MKKYSLNHYMYIIFFVLFYGSAIAQKGPVGGVGDEWIKDSVGAKWSTWWQVENNTPYEVSAEFSMIGDGSTSKIIFNKLSPWGISSPVRGGYAYTKSDYWYFHHLTSFIDLYTYDGPYGHDSAHYCPVEGSDSDASFNQPIRVIIDSPNQIRIVMGSKTCTDIVLPFRGY